MASRLNEEEIKRYLLHVYFGPIGSVPVKKAVNRAYLDFNRTLRGFGVHPERTDVRSSVGEYLEYEVKSLASMQMVCQDDFDSWHEATCMQLKRFYSDFPFTIGQSQKWINMAIKYLFIIDRERVEACWQYCHVPIDRILLMQLHEQGHEPPPIKKPWSRLDDYGEYLDFQRWFRSEFSGAPMDNEFRIWMNP